MRRFDAYLRYAKVAIAHISQLFRSISPERRVQVIIVAWLFGSFIKDSGGLGPLAAVAAPLLILRFAIGNDRVFYRIGETKRCRQL